MLRNAHRPPAPARVLVVGLAPWGAIAAADLASSGAAVHLVEEPALPAGDEGWDLVLACAPADDLALHEAVARLAHAARVPSVSAYLDGTLAVVGPAVLPGRTACFRCARMRRLACSPHPEIDRALHDALLAERPAPRERACLGPAVGTLGRSLAIAARDLLRLGEAAPLVGRVAIRDLVDLHGSLHAVLPMPTCDVCGGAAARDEPATPPRLEGARDGRELRRMLAGIVDARTGIVRDLVVGRRGSHHGLDLPITAEATLGARPPGASTDGRGAGLTVVDAMIGAVGEAVARYAASAVERNRTLRARIPEIRGDLIAAGLLDPERPLDWLVGRWLDTGEPVHVPASAVHGGDAISPPGLAAGTSFEDAARRAVLGLVAERAFDLTRRSRLPARRVEIDASIRPAIRDLARQLASETGRIAIYLLDAGIGVPVALAVVLGDFAAGSLAADPSGRRAVEQAIVEQGRRGRVIGRGTEDAAFLDAGGAVAAADLPELDEPSIRGLARRIAAAGLRLAAVDLTSPDLALTPFRVARVIGREIAPFDSREDR